MRIDPGRLETGRPAVSSLSRRGLIAGAAGAAAATSAAGAEAGTDGDPLVSRERLPLWPGGAPGGEGVSVRPEIVDRRPGAPGLDRAIRGVREPLLLAYPANRPTGAAALVVPGGGYVRVVIDQEGDEVARALAARGVSAFVLQYRQPGDGWSAGPETPLQDGRRAMRVIRREAARFGVDPAQLGVVGFSAGGHLAGSVAFRSAVPDVGSQDATDTLPAAPAWLAAIYPVATMGAPYAHAGSRRALLGEAPTPALEATHSLDRQVAPGAPPSFLVHAFDDRSVPAENSLALAASLRAARVSVEAHLFESGGHGFGLSRGPAAAWFDLFLAWLARRPAGAR